MALTIVKKTGQKVRMGSKGELNTDWQVRGQTTRGYRSWST